MKKNRVNILLSPWAVLAGMLLGIFIGIQFKGIAVKLASLGEIYLAVLQMCILPIMVTAVLSSLGRLLMEGEASSCLGRVLAIFVIGILLASAAGLSAGMILRPGAELTKEAQVTLGRKISEKELVPSEESESAEPAVIRFFREVVANNLVEAIGKGKTLPVLFFFILLGIAVGLVRSRPGERLLELINVLYDALLRIITWIMYGLPLGLCCLIASQASKVGPDILSALLRLIITCYICAIILILTYATSIRIKTGCSFYRSFAAFRETFAVALGTSSSFAAIPSALNALQNNLKLDEKCTKLIVPLGINLNPQGAVMYFAMSSVFIGQLYGTPVNFSSMMIILIGSSLAGLAATGVPGAGSLSMIALVLEPLGLPVATAVILLAAIDPIVDPILTLTTVHANCAASAMISTRSCSMD